MIVNTGYFKLTRKGRLTIPRLHECDQCGALHQNTFDYEITVGVNKLDEQGFIVDNFAVNDGFNKMFAKETWKASCEQLAVAGAKLIQNIIKVKPVYIKSTIILFDKSQVSFEWANDSYVIDELMVTCLPTQLDNL